MPPTLKFRQLSEPSRWTYVSGDWHEQVPSVKHDGNTEIKSFNFYVNERTLKDGAIEATVRLSSGTEPTGRLLFRYGPRGGYYAGVGGRNAHFAIRKFIDAKFGSVGLAAAGHPSDVRMNQPYELRVEFVGSRIVLRSSGVTVLEAEDSWFQDGHIGLNCYGDAKTEFSGIGMFEVPPVAELVEILERFPYVLRRDYEFH